MTKKIPDERPIDPTKNAQDIIGDTTGLTGITTSSPQEGGAEPDEAVPESSHLPGTVINEPNAHPSYGIPKEATSNKVYNKHVIEGMSEEQAQRSEDIATEKDVPDRTFGAPLSQNQQEEVGLSNIVPGTSGDPLASQGEIATRESPDEAGEQSVSGDMPDVEADDDTLANAQAVGTQQDEDTEHPQELDIGRDIDKAEEEILES